MLRRPQQHRNINPHNSNPKDTAHPCAVSLTNDEVSHLEDEGEDDGAHGTAGYQQRQVQYSRAGHEVQHLGT